MTAPSQASAQRRTHPAAKLLGANWIASRSVFFTRIVGPYGPQAWSAARSLLDRTLPAGLPAGALADPPATLPEALEELTRFVLDWVGHPVAPVERTPIGAAARDVVAIALGNPELTAAVFAIVLRVLRQSNGEEPADDTWIIRARTYLVNMRHEAAMWLKSSRKFIAHAAEERGIPWHRLWWAPQILQLGEGRYARRFDASATWRTPALSASVASNKQSGNQALRLAGLPAPLQVPVDDAGMVRKAVPALGLPLVLKPVALREMQGMRIVYDESDIDDAFAVAASFQQAVVAESYIPGKEYRVLVLDGSVLAALERLPVTITGDGHSTIAELVEAENRDPRRGSMAEGFPLSPISIEALGRRYLQECGRSTKDVPGLGEVVQVHPLPMMQFGGTGREDVTDRVHPDNREMAVRAVAIFGLDVAGIDLRMPDISQSWREVGAGICEVNPRPNLAVHYGFPSPIDVAGALIDHVYPPQDRLAMRHVLLVGEEGMDAHVAAVAQAMRHHFRWRVGTSGPSGIDLEGWRPSHPATTLPEAHGVIIEDPTLDAAVYAATPRAVTWEGLGTTRLDVAMATPAAADPLVSAAVSAAGTTLRLLPARPEETARQAVARLKRIATVT